MKTLTSLFIVGLVILATSVEFNRNSFVRVEREQSQFLLAETQDSVYQVDQMARLGRGVVHGLTWLPGREELAVTTAIGIWKYKISDLDLPELFEIQMGWHSATALSPNGVILASGSKDNIADNYVVQLWDVQSGKLLRTIDGFSDLITSIKFSPDSSMLACGDLVGAIHIYKSLVDTAPIVLRGHTQAITGIAIDLTNSTLSTTSIDGTVRFWDTETGNEIQTLADELGLYGQFLGVTFSPNGSMLAYWDSSKITLWDVWTHKTLKVFQAVHPWYEGAHHVSFSPDDKFLLYAEPLHGSEVVHVWNIEEDVELSVFKGGDAIITDIEISPDGKTLAVVSADDRVWLWNLETNSGIAELPGFTSITYDVAFSPDGKIVASANGDGTVRFWNLKDDKQSWILRGHNYGVNSVIFSSDGLLLASASQGDLYSSSSGSIRLWDVRSGMEQATFASGRNLREVALSPDGKLLVFTVDEADSFPVKLWDVANHEELTSLNGHTAPITSAVFSSDGITLATGDSGGDVWLWNIQRSEAVLIIHTGDYVDYLAFHPNGNLLAVANAGGAIGLWDIVAQKRVQVLQSGNSQVYGMAFSPGGAILAVPGALGVIQLWEWSTGTFLDELKGHNGWSYSCSFNPEGTVLASVGEDGTIRLWNVKVLVKDGRAAKNPSILTLGFSLGNLFQN